MMHRLAAQAGEWLDRSATLPFTFEGRDYQGYAGDTISSALAAAGLALLARSFKYHRPRSILSFANHDSNTLFQVDGVPNVRGDVTLLRAGMRVSALNTFGGLAHDKARVLDRFARLLPVGFYYKAFHSKRLFPRWERMFRALTGLGSVSLGAAREATPKRYGFCDVLVIGGAPADWRPRWQRPRPARKWRWWTNRCASRATVHRPHWSGQCMIRSRLPCMPRPWPPATMPITGWRSSGPRA